MNQITEIPSSDWPELRDKFLENWPSDHVGYYLVDNYIKWHEKESNIKNLCFYSLNGVWSDGTFVVIDRFQLFIYTASESNDRLRDLLRLLDWTKGFKVSSFRSKFRPAVIDVINELQLEMEYDKERLLYFLSRDNAKDFIVNPPDGYQLEPMSTLQHVEKASSIWSNRDEGSSFFLKRLMEWNPNIGLFTSNNELIAWCFRLQSGALGALQVDENYLRRGFGTMVTRKMSKILSDMNQDTFALVDPNNEPSKRMFEKIGFQVTDHTCKIRTKPTMSFKWED